MEMRIVSGPVGRAEIATLAEEQFGDFVKAVVDLEREIMVVGGELHADQESLLMETGSRQRDLWGINLHPGIGGEEWIEFDSMINVRPGQGNRSRGVEDEAVRGRIVALVGRLVTS